MPTRPVPISDPDQIPPKIPTPASPLVVAAIAIVSGILIGEAFSFFPAAVAITLLLLTGVAERRFSAGRRFAFAIPLVAMAFFIHPLLSTPISASDLRRFTDTGPIQITAWVDGPPRHDPNRIVLPMRGLTRQTTGGPRPVSGHFQLIFYRIDAVPFEYGDRLEMAISLRQPQSFLNPGVFDVAGYHRRQGSSGTASLAHPRLAKKVGEGGSRFLRRLFRLRENIRLQIAGHLTGPAAAILSAMLIGEAGGLTDAVWDVFSASGVIHLLSVSGSHLALVALLIFGGVRRALLRLPPALLLRLSLWKIPSQIAALATAGPVTFYALLAGAQTATIRSLVMVLVYLLAVWLRRADDPKTSLAVAALLILAFDPLAVFDLSFQFSFLSVLSMILASAAWPPPEIAPQSAFVSRAILRPAQIAGVATLAVTIGTLPLTLHHFHTFSLVGIVANVMAVPVAGFVIVPLGLFSVLLSLLVPGAAFPLAAVHQGIGTFFFDGLTVFARLPGADTHFASPPLWMVLSFYAVLALCMRRRASAWVYVVAMSSLLLLSGVRSAPKHLRISFLDVGQGDATLLEFPNGQVMLVDAGSGGDFDAGRRAVAPYLWQRRIRTIDDLIGSHPQQDHMGGMATLLKKFRVRRLWTNGTTSDALFYRAVQRHAAAAGLEERSAQRTTTPVAIGDCDITFLNPPNLDHSSAVARTQTHSRNNRSVVFRLHCRTPADFSLLMTGDIEQSAQQRLLANGEMLRSDLLKVPHHGSRGALDPDFLSAVAPKVAVIEAGRRNRYGHPHPEVVEAYDKRGIALYRTDRDGAVEITATPNGMMIVTDGSRRARPIAWRANVLEQEWENWQRVWIAFSKT